ncbi:MAG: polyribonucleotide nucleotidyltransferase [Candidatus Raymondbacteria bacterium RifOxyA12_full_50_37]|nr:MAG: polyribonucleotide nucleotidyltransferase [Candidatus Raymondbacteria bacterium RifOxyA12_full_50_37]OGJ88797.1 MAG: polyribonucleotide nucleotidyltransferase [Candidatus Raymondbacteria bacterium RIFOXYA2_FULL_49_16]OGJ96556.1 MAG: polyribonucleotide nucleotidyltransferase [Candidatus Raymondbacteria bacterium RIFOXYC2_FULL_50_21]OGK04440.1 MAG: polyribonucleotide nucleotidyltransferase [Candidatus Raymondbacteria bacterium RifOxyB12_full_50_8]OGP41943.1 MAG: polyribonucleotide nucleot
MTEHKREIEINGKLFSFSTGVLAKQANGSALVRFGDTMVLVAATATKEPKPNAGFFPLSVEYREKTYAAGKFPGGFFKRETRPSEKEILSARCIDRPIRPLFPKDMFNEVQVIAMVISQDQENDADVLAMSAASLALCLSDIPFGGPVAGVRVGMIDGEIVINPTFEQVEQGTMDMVVAGSRESILMVEGGGYEISEEEMIKGITTAHETIKKIVAIQEELVAELGKPKFAIKPPEVNADLVSKVIALAAEKIRELNKVQGKHERQEQIDAFTAQIIEQLTPDFPECEKAVKETIHDIEKDTMRERILNEGMRVDGRSSEDIRPITSSVGLLPRAHGSAIFTRGETQALVAATLGTKLDEQKIDALHGETYKDYMFHYNFPPFSTGEVKPIRGTSRREVGHGNLAERSLAAVLPRKENFPYTIRIVSEILESNGSSSMASVCGGSLSLMDAGVPIKDAVAGIAMGLIKEGEKVAILSDILGVEDHLGDMDFKVTGTKEGITAFQMDIKISGITPEIMRKALDQARRGRLHILSKMAEAITKPRKDLSPYAPRILSLKIAVSDIGMIIGPQGKVIKEIQEKTGATIVIEDDGTVFISSPGGVGGPEAKAIIEQMTEKPVVGKIYSGIVKTVTNFGAFVEYLPQKEGLVHISELAASRVRVVEDVCNVGDTITVKLIGIDEATGKVRLSKKAADGEAPQGEK